MNNSLKYHLSTIFSEIENQISTLQHFSTNDFGSFNEKLKQYNETVKKINNNSIDVLNILDSDSTSDYFTQLNFLHYKISLYVELFEEKIKEQIDKIEVNLKILNSIQLPLKNYKQNLITLKYLIANIKLNLLYEKNDTNIYDDLIQIESAVKEVIVLLPEFDEGLEKIKANIFLTLVAFKQYRERSVLNSSIIMHQTNFCLNLLNAKHSNIVHQVVELREKTKSCSDNVSKIIVNLQFHDIIRQKIEHVQTANSKILDEVFNEANEDEVNFNKIKDVTELQIAHLLHTNQKYQSAIETIIEQFTDIVNNLASSIPTHRGSEEINYKLPFSYSEDDFVDGVEIINNLNVTIDEFSMKIEKIKVLIDKIKTKNTNVFDKHNSLNTITLNFIDKYKNNEKFKDDSQKLLLHLKNTQVFQKNQDVLKNVFDDMYNISDDFLNIEIEEEKHKSFKEIIQNLGENVTNSVENLKNINNEVIDKLTDNYKVSNYLIVDIRYAVKNVKYYDYFEKVMETEILDKLNQLNNQLSSEIKNDLGYDKKEFLSKFESNYTMQSEREVHNSINKTDNQEVTNTDEDDVEFF